MASTQRDSVGVRVELVCGDEENGPELRSRALYADQAGSEALEDTMQCPALYLTSEKLTQSTLRRFTTSTHPSTLWSVNDRLRSQQNIGVRLRFRFGSKRLQEERECGRIQQVLDGLPEDEDGISKLRLLNERRANEIDGNRRRPPL